MSVFLALSLLVFATIVLSVFISATLSMLFISFVFPCTSVSYVVIDLIQVLQILILLHGFNQTIYRSHPDSADALLI